MPEYTEDDARFAAAIVERLVSPQREALDLEGALVISDLEADSAEFATELDFLGDFDLPVPAVRLGDQERVPVALSLAWGPVWPAPFSWGGRRGWRRHPMFEEWWHFYGRFLADEIGERGGIETMPREEARSTFLTRATSFLATRLAAVRDLERPESRRWSAVSFLSIPQRVGGPSVSTPGCNFTVSTNSSGLRVFWSGAYRLSPNYFSHPTTPTTGVLQSGTYVFGVDGGAYGNVIQWDRNAVVSLPGHPHAHLQF